MGFPALPGLPAHAPDGLINPVLDYDFGPEFNDMDGSGVMTVVPPRIKHVMRMMVPRVDADGSELGGVPVVLHNAPLGTYLGGTSPRAAPQGHIFNYAGGMIPFAKTKAERIANEDPRLSLEERYGNHAIRSRRRGRGTQGGCGGISAGGGRRGAGCGGGGKRRVEVKRRMTSAGASSCHSLTAR
jgi:hypothetical protein